MLFFFFLPATIFGVQTEGRDPSIDFRNNQHPPFVKLAPIDKSDFYCKNLRNSVASLIIRMCVRVRIPETYTWEHFLLKVALTVHVWVQTYSQTQIHSHAETHRELHTHIYIFTHKHTDKNAWHTRIKPDQKKLSAENHTSIKAK